MQCGMIDLMTSSDPYKASTGQPVSSHAEDPSMEDILASIRRILSEDGAAGPVPQPGLPGQDVLVLDASMVVPGSAPAVLSSGAGQASPGDPLEVEPSLVAPAVAAAAASSIGALFRSIAAEHAKQVYAGGPTIDDMVRGELRPLLKHWLDENLPPMVERLVRVELERIIGRSIP